MKVELKGDDIFRDGVKVGRVQWVQAWRRWKWTIGDAVGDEPSLREVAIVAGIFLKSEAERTA